MPTIDPVSQEPAPAPPALPEGHPLIQTPDRRLRVFVSSTLGELAQERRAVSRAISALRLTPVLFELGARPHPPRELYRAYLVQLAILAVARGRLDEAQALLDEGLAVSLAGYSTQNVTLALAAFAQLAFAEGDLERAALLAGAVEGLRQRAGLAVWPAERRQEADVIAQIRQALGTDRFDQVYAADARLSRRDAVAAARDQRTATRASAPGIDRAHAVR
jgi:hypothetical protein